MNHQNPQHFKALIAELKNGKPTVSIQYLPKESLPQGEILISVAYSSLNYKDALAVTGLGKILRHYPIVPGIDLAGTVEESSSPLYKKDDLVLVTGQGMGERYWGGYSQMARVKLDWPIPVPKGLNLKQAMGLGTAGFTAMQSVLALEAHGLTPSSGKVVVTGAAGGLGSIAIVILSKLGYHVVASTGRSELQPYLKRLGAKEIMDRKILTTTSDKPLESKEWAGAIDTVGAETLAGLIRSMNYGASIAVCGLAGGSALQTHIFPFVLRAINLLGINSDSCPREHRCKVWERLRHDMPLELLDQMVQIASLEEIPELSHKILKGQIQGRVVIKLK